MREEDKDLMSKLFTLAENYAGINQALKDLVNRLGSYQVDITEHKKLSAKRDEKILEKIADLDKDTTEEIRRLVDGMSKKIEEKHLTLQERIAELESDKKGVKWVLRVVLALMGGCWAFLIKNWERITN